MFIVFNDSDFFFGKLYRGSNLIEVKRFMRKYVYYNVFFLIVKNCKYFKMFEIRSIIL